MISIIVGCWYYRSAYLLERIGMGFGRQVASALSETTTGTCIDDMIAPSSEATSTYQRSGHRLCRPSDSRYRKERVIIGEGTTPTYGTEGTYYKPGGTYRRTRQYTCEAVERTHSRYDLYAFEQGTATILDSDKPIGTIRRRTRLVLVCGTDS